MSNIRILTEADLRGLVKLDLDAIECVEQAFAALATGDVVMPPILSMAIAPFNGEVDVKTAFVPGIDSFAIKISPGLFRQSENRPAEHIGIDGAVFRPNRHA